MKISNPLTIIATFSGVAESCATIALISLPEQVQGIFVYFVMLFPIIIVILFFLVLYMKPYVLYAPSDYENEDNFIQVNGSLIVASVEDAVEEVLPSTEGKERDNQELVNHIIRSINSNMEAWKEHDRFGQPAVSSSHKRENIYDGVLSHMLADPSNAFTLHDLAGQLKTSRASVANATAKLGNEGKISPVTKGNFQAWKINQNYLRTRNQP